MIRRQAPTEVNPQEPDEQVSTEMMARRAQVVGRWSLITLKRYPVYIGAFALVLLLALSLTLRQEDFKNPPGAASLEATYHVLHTVTALNDSPVSNHLLLPTVSLGRESDKHIPWGATIPTKAGDYIYTSFTPPGFLAPFLWFKISRLEPTRTNLAYFNFFIGCASTLLLYGLLFHLSRLNNYTPWTSAGSALIGCSIAIFSREALLSHGIIYWCHSLYQPILIATLYLTSKHLSSASEDRSRRYASALTLFALIGPLTEWTGFIFNTGLATILWLKGRAAPSSRVFALKILTATAIAGGLAFLHFSLAIGVEPAARAFLQRFLVRNTSAGNVVHLLQGYALSYGLFLLTVTLALAASLYRANKPAPTTNNARTFALILAASSFSLLENAIMLQHATQFSFDRLKLVFPASLLLAFSFAGFKAWGRVALTALILLSSIHGYTSYEKDLKRYAPWTAADASNVKFAQQIASSTDTTCAVFASNIGVRGYANLLFHRGIYEFKSIQDIPELLAKRNACAAVFLEATWVYTDLQRYTKATIMDRSGTVRTIVAQETVTP